MRAVSLRGSSAASLLWMGGAVVLHDAVFAPLVLVGSRILRRTGARVSWVQVAIGWGTTAS